MSQTDERFAETTRLPDLSAPVRLAHQPPGPEVVEKQSGAIQAKGKSAAAGPSSARKRCAGLAQYLSIRICCCLKKSPPQCSEIHAGRPRKLPLARGRRQALGALVVEDTGIGIPASAQPQFFREFFRVPGTEQISGTGLGLAITKHLVELLAGKIRVESEPGKGSCFEVVLPKNV